MVVKGTVLFVSVIALLVVPGVAQAYVAGPYSEECEYVLSEDFEGETFDVENPEDVAQMEQCETEAAESVAHPSHFDMRLPALWGSFRLFLLTGMMFIAMTAGIIFYRKLIS